MAQPPRHLHIISFDTPWPPDYGGVIDVFHKARALSDLGVRVHLHCFEYGRGQATGPLQFCESVHYYRRHTGRRHLLMRKPYIAVTRQSEELMAELLRDDHPILFEGLHTCLMLPDKRLAHRHKVVRTHNIEHRYYENLALAERNPFKRLYFKNEAGKLKRFEKVLHHAQGIAAISLPDTEDLTSRYAGVRHITAFHPNSGVETLPGRGAYCLYHGNLGVGENNLAALHLLRNIFRHVDIPLIIAGSRPSRELRAEVAALPHVELRADLGTEAIHGLIRHAQVNVLPTFQATGIKLKLLAALHMGRHCLVNGPMVQHTGLEPLCRVEDTDSGYIAALTELFHRDLTPAEVTARERILLSEFSNSVSAQRLVAMIWNTDQTD